MEFSFPYIYIYFIACTVNSGHRQGGKEGSGQVMCCTDLETHYSISKLYNHIVNLLCLDKRNEIMLVRTHKNTDTYVAEKVDYKD